MKKVKRALNILCAIVVGFIVFIPLLMFGFIMLCFAGAGQEQAEMRAVSKEVLVALGVQDADTYTTWHDLTIDGQLTAFEVPARAFEGTDGWITSSTTAAEYAAQLDAYAPEAAFLLPDAAVTFDLIHLGDGSDFTWYDPDTELLIHWQAQKSPQRGSVHIDTMKVAHSGWLYEIETHGGFHGDGTTFLAFIVPEEERSALTAKLATQEGWHPCAVTQAEYAAFQERVCYEVPPLFPAEDVVFDWCCYVDVFARMYPDHERTIELDGSAFPAALQEIGAVRSGNWLAAFYDTETGLMIYYEYDS